jgi:hypothetical protein
MQILYLSTIILTSISSVPPLAYPPVNWKCQITYVDLWGGGLWCYTECFPIDSEENQLYLNQTLHSACSNWTVIICSLKKNLTAYEI